MFFFAPAALRRFLKMLLAGHDEAHQNNQDSPRARRRRLRKLRQQQGGWRLGRFGPTFSFSRGFAPHPEITALPLRNMPDTSPERRRMPELAALSPTTAFINNEQHLLGELDTRGNALVNSLDLEVDRFDDQVAQLLQHPENAPQAQDLTEAAHRLVNGSQQDVTRLMERMDEIERRAAVAQMQAERDPVTPWWIRQMRRQTTPGPHPVDRRGPAAPDLATVFHERRALRNGGPTYVAPATSRLGNIKSQQDLREAARTFFLRPRTSGSRTPANPLQPLRASPSTLSRSYLFARLANIRGKVDEVRSEVAEAEQHLHEATQPKRLDRRRQTRDPAQTPRPRAPDLAPPTDPTRGGR